MINQKHIQALMSKGHDKDLAFQISQSDTIAYDYTNGNISSSIDEDTGFLKVSGIIARTGIQQYLGMELPKSFNLDPFTVYNVLRPASEVLKKESLDSYTNATITDNHPTEFVSVDNIKELGKGSISVVSTFKIGAIDYVKTDIIVTDKETIKNVQDGKVEISPGYTTIYKQEKGTFDGQAYDFIQTDILINHVALVDKGRCEGACKITDATNDIILSSLKKTRSLVMAKVKVGDAEFEVNDAVAGAFASMQSDLKSQDAEFEKFKKKSKEDLEEKDMENGKMAGEKESLKKENEELKKAGDVDIHALANDRAVLLAQVATQVGDTDVSKMTDSDIKVLALSKVTDMDLKDKSDEYIKGMFDTMVASKANDSINAFGEAFTKDSGTKVSARDTYIKKIEGGE